MHGRHVGSLAVYVTDDVTPTSAGPVWLQVGSAGSGWRRMTRTVNVTGNVQVRSVQLPSTRSIIHYDIVL